MNTIETRSNNPDLQDRLLSACISPPPDRMATIVDAIGGLGEANMTLAEVDIAARRIFQACNGENGQPKPDKETGVIVGSLADILEGVVRDRQVHVRNRHPHN